jgi:hypothetical protein
MLSGLEFPFGVHCATGVLSKEELVVAPLAAACKPRYHIGLYSEKQLKKEKNIED